MIVSEIANHNSQKLLALTQFLLGRATETTGKKQISQDAFIALAKSLGVNVTPETLVDLIAQPPLSNVMEPLDPNSGVIRFKGNEEVSPGMNVDQAEEIVDKNAKKAMKRGLSK